MKKRFALIMLAAIALAGCQKKELDLPVAESLPFIGTTESFDADTKTTLDEGRVLWKSGDQVSIFAGRTLNEQYQVTDASEGLTTAAFNVVSTPGFVSSVAISNNVAYYPYADRNVLTQHGNVYELSTTIPAVQQYAEDSFGPGAFPMTSVTSSTSDYNLKFKNVLGGLKLQLKGDAKIASISITGNADEVLCGAAKVSVAYGDVPSIELTDASANIVTLDCGAGVQLSSSEATSFIIALPPITFCNGFTVTVTDTDGKTMEISTDKSQTISRSGILKMPAKEYDGTSSTGQASRELCFTAEKAGSTVTLNNNKNPYDVPQEYCTDGENWYPYTFGTSITLANVGDKVYFRKMTDGVADGFSKGYDYNKRAYYYYHFTMSGRLAASGNVMSLIDRTCQSTTVPNDYCYFCLFSGCTSLTQAPVLPATTLARECYAFMFSGCTALTQAPELPATTLADHCYEEMFKGCKSLTQAPELPATTLADYCYRDMFYSCTSLTQAPELPATTLANSCYYDMFVDCTSLTQAPELPATTLSEACYENMFSYCTALMKAPKLPATTLADDCYRYMFYGCTSLTQAPELPATTLANYCYRQMFAYCSALTQAPELPATKLADYCYRDMFEGCTSLTQAPELPATTLAESCYAGMFSRCTSLTQAPELPATTLSEACYANMFIYCTALNEVRCYATDISASDATISWLYNVSSTGTFYADPSANWSRGDSGIPEGWDVEIDGEVDPATRPFTITSTGSTTVAFVKEGSPFPVTLEYRVGNGAWSSYTIGSEVSLAYGESVQFRAGEAGNKYFSKGYDDYYNVCVNGSGEFSASGNIMSLLDRTMKRDYLSNFVFNGLFRGCARLADASSLILPATTLAGYCYLTMFSGCTGLKSAPELPATTLARECYEFMFSGCTGLTAAPELPATTLADCCYAVMFEGCTGLTSAPELRATTLADYCYDGMFRGCTGLTSAPELRATTLAYRCYSDMFSGCTGLTAAPELPATTLADYCYRDMFYGCTALKEVRCHANDISASDATTSWLYGVSSTGTFYADPSANWSRGSSGIPEGWTVKTLGGTSSQPSKELCFTAEQAGSTVALIKKGDPYDVPQEYCTDEEHWYPYTFGTTITLANVGDKVYFRKMTDGVAEGFSKYDTGGWNCYHFTMSGRLAASGNVMSLVDRTCQSTTIPNDHCFTYLFYGCTSLTQAPELPATTLADSCYYCMFKGCTSLAQAPELPATTLANSCYYEMFSDCTALTQAPELPATTMAESCYWGMFYDCTSLAQAPELPATTLADVCYRYMFHSCKSLTQAPELPATTLASYCYYCIFYGCTSLKEVRCYATDISASDATTYWLYNVSSTGTFYVAPSASWKRGPSGIPKGWTVKTLSE